jgi:hypothetical protein
LTEKIVVNGENTVNGGADKRTPVIISSPIATEYRLGFEFTLNYSPFLNGGN